MNYRKQLSEKCWITISLLLHIETIYTHHKLKVPRTKNVTLYKVNSA